MSDLQAQCWFMVCPDCGECVESMDIHCGGAMRGNRPNPDAIPALADDSQRGDR